MADQTLGKVELKENWYKADLELHDRYQSFSSELLKLSLAGIGVIGFILGYLQEQENGQQSEYFFWMIVFAGIAFSISLGGALLHKFTASKGLYYHIRALRLRLGFPDSSESIIYAETQRDKLFKLSGKGFLISSIFLFVGGSLIVISFINAF